MLLSRGVPWEGEPRLCGGLERGEGRGREKAEAEGAVMKAGPGCGH